MKVDTSPFKTVFDKAQDVKNIKAIPRTAIPITDSKATKLENALKDAWDDERYWETKPYLLISKIKIMVDEIIIESFKSEGRVSIAKIYNVLKDEPFVATIPKQWRDYFGIAEEDVGDLDAA